MHTRCVLHICIACLSPQSTRVTPGRSWQLWSYVMAFGWLIPVPLSRPRGQVCKKNTAFFGVHRIHWCMHIFQTCLKPVIPFLYRRRIVVIHFPEPAADKLCLLYAYFIGNRTTYKRTRRNQANNVLLLLLLLPRNHNDNNYFCYYHDILENLRSVYNAERTKPILMKSGTYPANAHRSCHAIPVVDHLFRSLPL